MLYRILDSFFLLFHTSLILFCLFGWIWKRTRLANLAVILVTAFSWGILGLLIGSPGYCPLTDWHFSILNKLGVTDLPNSYIKYLADRIFNSDLNEWLVDACTLSGLITGLVISAFLNYRDLKRKKGLNSR